MPNHIQQFIRPRDPIRPIDDRTILAHDEHRPVDRSTVFSWLPRNRLQRAILRGESQVFVHQEIEGQLEMHLEALVAVEVVTADAEWNGIEISIGVDCPANRGQLVRSPRGEVFRVKNQQHPVGAEVVREGCRRAACALDNKIDRRISNLWSRRLRQFSHVGILCESGVRSPVPKAEVGNLVCGVCQEREAPSSTLDRAYGTNSIRSSAIRASFFVTGSTSTRLTTSPCARCSNVQRT